MKILLRPGWRHDVVQWSTTSCTIIIYYCKWSACPALQPTQHSGRYKPLLTQFIIPTVTPFYDIFGIELYFPLVLMGGQANRSSVCRQGTRTPIGASGNFVFICFHISSMLAFGFYLLTIIIFNQSGEFRALKFSRLENFMTLIYYG